MDFSCDDRSMDQLIAMADDPQALARLTEVAAEHLHPDQITELIQRLEGRRDEVAMEHRVLGPSSTRWGSGRRPVHHAGAS